MIDKLLKKKKDKETKKKFAAPDWHGDFINSVSVARCIDETSPQFQSLHLHDTKCYYDAVAVNSL